MQSAIVLINAEIGEETSILEGVCALEETDEAYLVYGVYDILVKITAQSMEALEATITGRIRRLPGVMSTLTLIVSRECVKG